MSNARDLVLGPGALPVEDELRLPRPPGVFRRFWARHPLLADVLIAIAAFLLSTPSLTIRSDRMDPPSGPVLALTILLAIIGCIALVWRRRWPVAVFILTLAPVIVVDPDELSTVSGPATVVAIYSIAVYRSAAAGWVALGTAGAALGLNILARSLAGFTDLLLLLNIAISFVVSLLLGTLIGVNVGNRRRYLEALIARSRQLLVERDQQAQLAAAAERTRIAREMHDVVSHSLTVVVALAEGAAATDDPARAREASRAVSATAREALVEMRGMLGVLREDPTRDDAPSTPLSPPAPLSPLLGGSVDDVVAAARNAGFPVSLTVMGPRDVSPQLDHAVLRIAQEGLTNAMRHALDPTFIRVGLEYTRDEVIVQIENDGAHDHTDTRGSGVGLIGLRERVGHLGGSMDTERPAPARWRLRARLPREAAHA